MKITLKDGSVKEVQKGISVLELAKEIRKSSKDEGLITDLKQAKDSNLENEMVDVFICLMGMFELLDIKLVDALKRKENKNYNREWE